MKNYKLILIQKEVVLQLNEQLVKSIYFTRYQSIIGHWILMVEMPEDEKNPFSSTEPIERRKQWGHPIAETGGKHCPPFINPQRGSVGKPMAMENIE